MRDSPAPAPARAAAPLTAPSPLSAADGETKTVADAPPRVPDWLHLHRAEIRARYDSSRYDWPTLVANILHTPEWPVNPPIHRLHDVAALPDAPPRYIKLAHAYRHAGWKMPRRWADAMRPGEERRAFKAMRTAPEHLAFLDAYRAFVREEVAPICGDPAGVVFQCPPTLRVAMPSRAPTIQPHKDSDYPRHQPSEINFWVPVGDVWGNNALWLESTPGEGDFAPREMRLGEMLRFDGYNRRHLTRPNDTGHTRVSFDFRVVPASLYREYVSPRGRGRDTGKIGDYAAEATARAKLRDPTPA